MSGQTELQDIQAWLHTFVVAPGDSEQALEAAEKESGFAAGSAEELILPSPTLSPQERIEIYRGMYLLRMQEALEIDFPSLLDRLGAKAFHELVARYVNRYPSQSYTLDHLGHRLATFLKEENTAEEGDFLSELAFLEWSMCEVAIAPNSPVVGLQDLAAVDPERFVELSFQTVPAFRLHQFAHNANEVFRNWSDSGQWTEVRPEPTYLVVWRQELDTWRLDLNMAQFRFLTCLANGMSLGKALDQTIESDEASEEECFEWFQNWMSEGFFSSFELPPN